MSINSAYNIDMYQMCSAPSGRVEIVDSLSLQEVDELVSNRNIKYLQFSGPLNSDTYDLLNSSFFSVRPDVQLRCYGFSNQVCDLSFLKMMPNLVDFSADCLHGKVINIESLALLRNLKHLAIGMWELEDLDFLNQVPSHLLSLSIEQSKSAKPDLSVLSRFKELNHLYLEKQTKNIEVISELSKLTKITLRSVSTKDIAYLLPLKKTLMSLEIKLGGLSDLSLLEGFEQLIYLELWQIRGLEDISFISSLTGLEKLKLESLRNVKTLPPLHKLKRLKNIELGNMKGLQDVSTLSEAPVLESFLHWSAENMDLSDYDSLLNSDSLNDIRVFFGSQRKNDEFKKLAMSKGKIQIDRGINLADG